MIAVTVRSIVAFNDQSESFFFKINHWFSPQGVRHGRHGSASVGNAAETWQQRNWRRVSTNHSAAMGPRHRWSVIIHQSQCRCGTSAPVVSHYPPITVPLWDLVTFYRGTFLISILFISNYAKFLDSMVIRKINIFIPDEVYWKLSFELQFMNLWIFIKWSFIVLKYKSFE